MEIQNTLELFLRAWLLMASIMFLLWGLQTKTKNANAVDVAWALGFFLVAVVVAPLSEGNSLRVFLVALIISIWSLRLGSYLYFNRIKKHKEEDGRYKTLREKWNQKDFFIFYQFQGIVTAGMSIPVIVAMGASTGELSWRDSLGFLWGIGAIFGEWVADKQLAAHRSNPAMKGKSCRTGLWKYSRHPNYFFEWMHWWSYVIIGFSFGWGALTLLGPLLMYFFLFRMTGIPPTEAQALKSRVDYADYQKTTNMFFLWFPKKQK